jgi:hypothetical protein
MNEVLFAQMYDVEDNIYNKRTTVCSYAWQCDAAPKKGMTATEMQART